MKESDDRYSDSDLALFRTIIDKKLESAVHELEYYQSQILELAENVNRDQDDWLDSILLMADLEFLNGMSQKQKIYVRKLESAQMRILDRTYGKCEITGELIDSHRLMASPTTTRSYNVKTTIPAKDQTTKSQGLKGDLK